MPRRRAGTLLPLERSILAACLASGASGTHGFALAKTIADAGDSRALTATGTLYRALQRLAEGGLLESWWEDPDDAAEAGRPRRRLYRVTGAGAAAFTRSQATPDAQTGLARLDPGLMT